MIPSFASFSCRHEAFDSEMLGGPVLRLHVGAPDSQQMASDLSDLARFAREHLIRLVICRIPYDSYLANVLKEAGFRKVEELVLYSRPLTKIPADSGTNPSIVEDAQESDVDDCVRLAASAFSYDRYHADGDISDSIADAVKAAWVRNCFEGRADQTLVERFGSEVRGFVSILQKENPPVAIIDLIAVNEESRGIGVGKSLLVAAMRRYAERASIIQAGTQLENLSSCRLYESNGFSIKSRWKTFHALPNGKLV